MRYTFLPILLLALSSSFAADQERPSQPRIAYKDEQCVLHLVPTITKQSAWVGMGQPNSMLLTKTDRRSGTMITVFMPSTKQTREGTTLLDSSGTTTMTYLDGVVCDETHVFVFVISNSHWSTMRVQNLMKHDELAY